MESTARPTDDPRSTILIDISAVSLDGHEPVREFVRIANGIVVENRKSPVDNEEDPGGTPEGDINSIQLEGLIIPLFINGHTHMGDAAAREEFNRFLSSGNGKEPGTMIEEIFKPPAGLKFRLLSSLGEEEKIRAMAHQLHRLAECGCGYILAFREEGVDGVRMLNEAYRRFSGRTMPESHEDGSRRRDDEDGSRKRDDEDGSRKRDDEDGSRKRDKRDQRDKVGSAARPLVLGTPNLRILARPSGLDYRPDEVDELLSMPNVVGIGVSGMGDWDRGRLMKISDHCRERGSIFALHFSEGRRENVDDLIQLRPDFVVHAIHAEREDFRKLSDADIEVVFCPGSNRLFGMEREMRRAVTLASEEGITFCFGSDNAMLHPPDMMREIRCAFQMNITPIDNKTETGTAFREWWDGASMKALHGTGAGPGSTAKSIKESWRMSTIPGERPRFILLECSGMLRIRTKRQFLDHVLNRSGTSDIRAIFI